MYRLNQSFKLIILVIISWLFLIGMDKPIETELTFTEDEQNYIANASVIKASSIVGSAPISYIDSDGEIRGISKELLDKISEMTGLTFEHRLYDTLAEAMGNGQDIMVGLSSNYALSSMTLSVPFLTSETILYINSSLDPERLEDKRYAALKGSDLPQGVTERTPIYYDTREESLNAVNAGKADYSYGNSYSIAFYTLQNGYKNIITIPKKKESREYCIGLIKEDKELLSIINKSINAIDEQQMQTIILNVASHIEQKITLSMIMDTYGKEIFFIISLAIGILLVSVIFSVRAKNKLQIQNTRYERLSQISNEYLYEFCATTNQFTLSEKMKQLFERQEDYGEAIEQLRTALLQKKPIEDSFMIRIPFRGGKIGVFKSVHSVIYDSNKKPHSIIGKLVDISEETAEKENLIAKSQLDGLTGLYNAATIKELIAKRMETKPQNETDALVLIDLDRFKGINDTFGHLRGNQILESVGKSLKLILRKADRIGRVGGDEFCVYMEDVPSADFVLKRYTELNKVLQEVGKEVPVSSSIGFALFQEESTYEDLFEKADKALYHAKGKGVAQVVDYNEI